MNSIADVRNKNLIKSVFVSILLPALLAGASANLAGIIDGIIVGNIIGSNVFNILFVIGLSGLIVNIPFEPQFIFDAAVSIGAAVLLWLCSLNWRHTLNRAMGTLMLIAYAAYFAVLI